MSTAKQSHRIFITGGTGYIGRHLIPRLLQRGHRVSLLIRPGSERKQIAGCDPVVGNPMDAASYVDRIAPADTFVHLIGVPKPAPWKGAQFRAVDLRSARAAVDAAAAAGIGHFVYISVAQPAPVMKAYLQVRAEVEAMIRADRLNATILRPWYVLGPGHRWPIALLPFYRLLAQIPATREGAERLGLVTIDRMAAALQWSIEHPADGIRILTVPEIRKFG